MTKSTDLGQRIKRFRLERDMSQAEASVHFGVSYSTISRLEGGASNVSDLVRAKIERQLETEVSR